MVRLRRGVTKLGCLLSLLIVVAIGYFGFQVGQVYFRFLEFQDAMRQQVRFASSKTNQQIIRHLQSKADSLGLPESAQLIRVYRNNRRIEIESEYYDHIELPLYVHEVYLNPKAQATF